jgi:hypothetical protein
MAKHNQAAKQAILDVVATQLKYGNQPETQQNYKRLVAAGYSDEDARIMIGQVVACEIFDVIKEGQVYNHDRFVARLSKLPEEPFDD